MIFLNKDYANMLVANIGLVYISPIIAILVKNKRRTCNTWQTEEIASANRVTVPVHKVLNYEVAISLISTFST